MSEENSEIDNKLKVIDAQITIHGNDISKLTSHINNILHEKINSFENSLNNLFGRMKRIEDYHEEDISMRKMIRDVQDTIDNKIDKLEQEIGQQEPESYKEEEPYLTLSEEQTNNIFEYLTMILQSKGYVGEFPDNPRDYVLKIAEAGWREKVEMKC